MKTVKDIVASYLRKIGADGLIDGDGCCCGMEVSDGLMPCGNPWSCCEPATGVVVTQEMLDEDSSIDVGVGDKWFTVMDKPAEGATCTNCKFAAYSHQCDDCNGISKWEEAE